MTKTKRTILSLFLTAIFLSAAFSVKAFKIDNYDDKVENRFIVSPGRIELDMSPGSKIKEEIYVVNRLGEKKDFSIEAKISSYDGGKVPEEISYINWIKLDADKFSLQQGGKATIEAEITIPEEVIAGGYYYSIIISTKGEKSDGKDQINITSQIELPILLTVVGEGIVKSGILEDFSTDRFFYGMGPVRFKALFSNLGNVHLQPEGEISVYNFIGAKIAQIPLKEWVVYPGASEEREVQWNKRWLFGIYRAKLDLFYDNNQQKVEDKLVFIGFPWIIFVLVIILLIGLYYLIKHLHSGIKSLGISIEIKKKKKDGDDEEIKTEKKGIEEQKTLEEKQDDKNIDI